MLRGAGKAHQNPQTENRACGRLGLSDENDAAGGPPKRSERREVLCQSSCATSSFPTSAFRTKRLAFPPLLMRSAAATPMGALAAIGWSSTPTANTLPI